MAPVTTAGAKRVAEAKKRKARPDDMDDFANRVGAQTDRLIRAGGWTESQVKAPVTLRTVLMNVAGLYVAVADAMATRKDEIAALADRIGELADRVAAVEGHGLKFQGVWQRALAYPRGSVVTDSGSAWIALRGIEEGQRPGAPETGWQLMVKAGKDAKA